MFKPKNIFFGEKDYQQLLLIKKFIKNKFQIKIFSCSTIRDKNNVALSSRNVLLSHNDIKKSSFIANLLFKFKKQLKKNITFKKNLKNIILKINSIQKVKIEYLEIRNKKNLSKNYNKNNFKIFLAYYNNKIRLIDNY
jgi:pantoate--beta-alanine ligase